MLPALLAAAVVTVAPDSAIRHYPLKGAPFGVVATHDSHRVFVATAKGEKGLAVYDIGENGLTRTGFAALDGAPADFALTPDEGLAVVAAGPHVYFVDTNRLMAGGQDAVLGHMDLSAASINAAVSPDGHFAFVAEERDGVVTVIDLDKARAGNFARSAIVGRVPLGNSPVGMAFSKDGQWLYVTVEVVAAGLNWPEGCNAEGHFAQGAVMTLKVAAAETGAPRAVAGVAAAECSAVRIRLSDDGATAYVTARSSNDVVAFDTAKLPGAVIHKAEVSAPAGPSPVGIAIDGQRLFIALSNRFEQGEGVSSVVIADAKTLAVTGRIPAGVFPREVAVTPDHRWLFVGNFGSNDLEQVDLRAVQ